MTETLEQLPGILNLSFVQGDDFQLRLTFDNGATPPVAINLSSYSAFAAKVGDIDFVVNATDKATGVIVLTLAKEVTDLMLQAPYLWDFQWVEPDDRLITVLAGQVMVTKQITP